LNEFLEYCESKKYKKNIKITGRGEEVCCSPQQSMILEKKHSKHKILYKTNASPYL